MHKKMENMGYDLKKNPNLKFEKGVCPPFVPNGKSFSNYHETKTGYDT